jgi:dTDP-4-amino-4,6-dideoxygalactose transaminase
MEKINWNNPKFGTKELELVKQVLETGYVSEGPMTKEAEKRLAEIVGTKHVILTTSATAALYLAIEADKRIRNYTEGEVVIPNLTFLATRQAVEMAGLKTKIVDVDYKEHRFGIHEFDMLYNNDKIFPDIITSSVKGIIIVNLLGRSESELEKEDDEYFSNRFSIMDNAGCLGSNVPNGKVGCYSLQANKLLTCGQGGFCATNDDEYAKVIRQLKDFGRTNKDQQDTKGFNFKFNDIQAAVVLGQLEQLEERKKLHLHQYFKYSVLNEHGKLIDFNIEAGEIPLWIEFITDKRDELFDYLKSKGIEARKPWLPLIDDKEKYPNTYYYCKNCLWLPNGASLTSEQQNEVIRTIQEFYAKQ